MTRGARVLLVLFVLAVAAGGAVLASVVKRGVSARDEPTRVETILARRLRHLAIPRELRGRANPVPASGEVLASARAHFADHCAICHGNDGKGETTIGRNMYPKAPDMTLAATQNLSDGELFAIIENGVRLTGMPGWGGPGTDDDTETWQLVRFIRHLPQITPDELAEMESLNPKSAHEREEAEEIRKFLDGESPAPAGHEHAGKEGH
jgi:mono/diheme cytochrome c family protein